MGKRTFLAMFSLSLALVILLIIATRMDVAHARRPATGERPTPTPDGYHAVDTRSQGPESPEVPPLPDLIVESIEVEPARPLIEVPARIRVTIKNRGSRDVPVGKNFFTDLYVDPPVEPGELEPGVHFWGCQSWWVPAGGSHVLTTTWVFTEVKPYTLFAQVDTGKDVEEEREYNNVLGSVWVETRAPAKTVHQTHDDFQMGMASNMDLSHPEGVMRRGVLWQPWIEPDVYTTDNEVNDPTVIHHPDTGMRQINPALSGTGDGAWLFTVWEDGRDGGVFNRRLYSRRSGNGGDDWADETLLDQDPAIEPSSHSVNQLNPDLAYDPGSGNLYAVWQDNRNGADNYDIYFARSSDNGLSWSFIRDLIQEPGATNQTNPSIAVGPSGSIYVVWQDARNGNQDIYLARSDDGGGNWSENYFVTDEPDIRWASQESPAVAVQEDLAGSDVVYATWEDWRNLAHPEVYVATSDDRGETFGIDVPITVPGGDSYRVEPTIKVGLSVSATVTETQVFMHDIHVAWQEGVGEDADIYWTYANRSYVEPSSCLWPNDICFEPPQKVNGFVIDSSYVRPPDPSPTWPIEPSWQGQVSIDLATEEDLTGCIPEETEVYSRGLFLVWSDARSYDDWRFELHTRRIASPGGFGDYVLCQDSSTGVNPDNAKLYNYRSDLDDYDYYKPAATRQSNPYIYRDDLGQHVVWDDDRWDIPSQPGRLQNRDIFAAQMGIVPEAIYISPVIDAGATSAWYLLSWWAATEHSDQVLFQTRFGISGAGEPPKDGSEGNGWTAWTGNPGGIYPDPPFNGCEAGTGCYYDAPGRYIVGHEGNHWPEYRFLQYKAIIRQTGTGGTHPFKTAISQVTIHYEGPEVIYLPMILRGP